MLECYLARKSLSHVTGEFRKKHPDAVLRNKSTITQLVHCFRESGSVMTRKEQVELCRTEKS